MSPGARVDSDSPRRLAAAVRRLVGESEGTAASALAAVGAEVDEARRELAARRRRLEDARRRLAEAETALARCLQDPRANCSGPDRAVQAAAAEVRRQESRVRVAEGALTEIGRQRDRLAAAQRRLVVAQRRSAEGAGRELAGVSAGLESYLAGTVPAGGAGSAPTFSSDRAQSSWAQGFTTPAGRAYFPPGEGAMRDLAAALKPFEGEYTVDAHGSPTSVSVGGTELNAPKLAELVQADPGWRGRPVRLFSCNTGQGEQPIAADLAAELNVKVTAPEDLVWSNSKGESWVGPYEWKMVGGTMQRVPGLPRADGWKIFKPGHDSKGGGG